MRQGFHRYLEVEGLRSRRREKGGSTNIKCAGAHRSTESHCPLLDEVRTNEPPGVSPGTHYTGKTRQADPASKLEVEP